MKCGFYGNGGMSRAIQEMAKQRGHVVTDIVGRGDAFCFSQSDVVFEVSVPDAAVEHIQQLCKAKKDIIIATTAWYEHLPKVKEMVDAAGVRCLWSSNFSIGVNLYLRIVEAAAKLFNAAEEYDIWATELHHRNKIDSPSGTAKDLEKILLKHIARKTAVVEEKLDRKREPHEIHFSSTRGGISNFSHTVAFDSEADCITITHSARNRNGYALGAVQAAEWLIKQPAGLYDMDDFLRNAFVTT